MSEIVYISEYCYIDRSNKEIVNTAEGPTKVPLQRQIWRFFELLINNPHKIVEYNEFITALGFSSGEAGVIRRVNNVKAKARSAMKSAGLTDEEVNRIISRRSGGYRFNPPEKKLSIANSSSLFLKQVDITENEASSLVDLMLNKGLSGKMGRHSLLSMALNGNVCAMFEIGELYYYGYITENETPNYRMAYEWYRKAAQKRHPAALWTMGYMEIRGIYNPDGENRDTNYMRAYMYLKEAEQLGSPAAMTSIGQLWEEGHIPTEDYNTSGSFCPANMDIAMEQYKKADALGYHYATNRLAKIAEEKGDYQLAFNLYYRVGHMIADGYTYNKLGLLYENGLGCKRDIEKACQYYIMSVESVFPNDITPWGMFNAGRAYCGQILGQAQNICDLEKGLTLILQALDKLPINEHGQLLAVLLEVLIRIASQRKSVEIYMRYIVSATIRTDDYLQYAKRESDLCEKGNETEQIERMKRTLEKLL